MASKPHLLRGEDETRHKWTLDRLPEGLQASNTAVKAAGRVLTVNMQESQHQWELPVDVDLAAPMAAHLHDNKLTMLFQKKPHTDDPEELRRMHVESMADNRLREVPVADTPPQ